MENVLNNGFYEMSLEEEMLLDGGNIFDDLAEGLGNAFGIKDVTASDVAVATGETAGELIQEVRCFFNWLF